MTIAAHHSAMPDTVMAHAFLAALLRWAARQSSAVDAKELRRVVLGLVRARSDSMLRATPARWKE